MPALLSWRRVLPDPALGDQSGRTARDIFDVVQPVQLTLDHANNSAGVPVVSAINSAHEALDESADPTTQGVQAKGARMLSR
jgi:hypothetical protein